MVDVKYDDYALIYDVKTKLKVTKLVHLYGKVLTSSAAFCVSVSLVAD